MKENKKQKSQKKKGEEKDLAYAHNPRYCMILPDSEHPREEEISSTGQS